MSTFEKEITPGAVLGAAAPADETKSDSAVVGGKRTLDRRFVLAALMLVMVLASVEQTITSTSMPTIIGDLHGLEHYAWVMSVFLLASVVSMPLFGRLADSVGRKRVIVGAILLFMLGSVLAAFSQTMTQLIVFRGVQGLGAGGIMPVVLTIAADIFTLKERAKIQGFFSMVWGTAALAGPALGAFLVATLGWRSVFWVNLPLGAIGLAVLLWKYHDLEEPHPADLDLPGVGALTVAGVSLLALVSNLGADGWSWPTIALLLTLGVVAILFLIYHERRAAYPILPPDLLMRRAIGPSILASLLFGLAFLSLDTYVPLYVQGGLGGGVGHAAAVVTPVMLTWAASGMIAAPLLIRWGFRKTALVGSSVMVCSFGGLVLCARYDAHPWVLTGVLLVTGLGFGFASMSYLLAAQGAVAWQQRGSITSAVTLFRSIGGALGVGLLGALFNVLTREKLTGLAQYGVTPARLLDPRGQVDLPPALAGELRHAIASGLGWVFVAMFAVVVVQWLVTLLMPGGKPGHAVSAREGMEAIG
ncbi:MAG: MFS transporter [Phycisphaerae bacterium]